MSSSSSSTQNIAFVSSSNSNTSSTNEAVNTAHGFSTASTQVNVANSINIDNLSDAVICSFFASEPNSPQIVHEDLQQIYPNDMEEMDLRWPNYALMAFSSDLEVSNDSICSKSCLETIELLKSQNDQLLKDLKKSELMVLAYKIGEITIRELRKKLEIVQKEKDGIQLNVDKFKHASKIPPPYTGNFMPPTPDLSFTGLDEFVNKPVIENSKAMPSKEEPKVFRKYDDAPSIEEWVSDDEKEDVSQPKTEKKIVMPSIVKKEFVKSRVYLSKVTIARTRDGVVDGDGDGDYKKRLFL
ncbi:hypothetical protein Tco_1416701 [Tanacetum coccineum]